MNNQELNSRNTAAVMQTLRDMENRIATQQKLIDNLTSMLGSAMTRVNNLELAMHVQKATSFGHGPSVK